MGRTNIVIDDQLIKKAMELTGARTKREAVHIALLQLVSREDLYRALEHMRGKARWDGNVDSWRRSRT